MSEAKATVIRILQNMPDDTSDEMEIIRRLYMLVRLENSRKKSEDGVLTDEELDEHFFHSACLCRSVTNIARMAAENLKFSAPLRRYAPEWWKI